MIVPSRKCVFRILQILKSVLQLFSLPLSSSISTLDRIHLSPPFKMSARNGDAADNLKENNRKSDETNSIKI